MLPPLPPVFPRFLSLPTSLALSLFFSLPTDLPMKKLLFFSFPTLTHSRTHAYKLTPSLADSSIAFSTPLLPLVFLPFLPLQKITHIHVQSFAAATDAAAPTPAAAETPLSPYPYFLPSRDLSKK